MSSKSSKPKPSSKTSSRPPRDNGIPEVVSRRMLKRMAIFSGIPSFLGMSTFVVSYLLVSQDILPLPTYAVLLLSLGFFGLGVVGLSYGVLSASWEEANPGSKLGIEEFKINWGRVTEGWQEKGDRKK